MIIELRHRDSSFQLRSKLVWQELFNDYRNNGGNLACMHDLLCDLRNIEELFKTYKDFTFYWRHSCHITELSLTRETYLRQLKVQFFQAERKVEIMVLAPDAKLIT